MKHAMEIDTDNKLRSEQLKVGTSHTPACKNTLCTHMRILQGEWVQYIHPSL
jgi:hypothetical protein